MLEGEKKYKKPTGSCNRTSILREIELNVELDPPIKLILTTGPSTVAQGRNISTAGRSRNSLQKPPEATQLGQFAPGTLSPRSSEEAKTEPGASPQAPEAAAARAAATQQHNHLPP